MKESDASLKLPPRRVPASASSRVSAGYAVSAPSTWTKVSSMIVQNLLRSSDYEQGRQKTPSALVLGNRFIGDHAPMFTAARPFRLDIPAFSRVTLASAGLRLPSFDRRPHSPISVRLRHAWSLDRRPGDRTWPGGRPVDRPFWAPGPVARYSLALSRAERTRLRRLASAAPRCGRAGGKSAN
jgi:hypothetical protein